MERAGSTALAAGEVGMVAGGSCLDAGPGLGSVGHLPTRQHVFLRPTSVHICPPQDLPPVSMRVREWKGAVLCWCSTSPVCRHVRRSSRRPTSLHDGRKGGGEVACAAFYNMDCIKPFRVQKQADGLQAPACCLLAMLLATVLVIDSLSHRLYQVAKGE